MQLYGSLHRILKTTLHRMDDDNFLDMSGDDLIIRETQDLPATFSKNTIKKLSIHQTICNMGTDTINNNNKTECVYFSQIKGKVHYRITWWGNMGWHCNEQQMDSVIKYICTYSLQQITYLIDEAFNVGKVPMPSSQCYNTSSNIMGLVKLV